MPTQPSALLTLSFRAKRGICFFFAACALMTSTIQAQTKRPKILSISGVTLYVSDLQQARHFYSEEIGLPQLTDPQCEEDKEICYGLGKSQRIDILKGNGSLTDSAVGECLVGEVTFLTDDIMKMRDFLAEHHVHNMGVVQLQGSDAFPNKRYHLTTVDPDGHRIGFIQYDGCVTCLRSQTPPAPTGRMIHAGFIVRNKIGMDQFYKDILGFRPYWHGGMKDDETSWISLQVPDGTDWVEFMVNLPSNPDQHLRGVMNHIALGVPDIQKAREQLVKNGVHLTEEPKLGRDGKWQLNLYDPDQTRVEFMEFTPKEKPCCSEFTGPHPKP